MSVCEYVQSGPNSVNNSNKKGMEARQGEKRVRVAYKFRAQVKVDVGLGQRQVGLGYGQAPLPCILAVVSPKIPPWN